MLSIWQWSRYAAATLAPPVTALQAEPGAYALTGAPASLVVTRSLAAAPGTYALAGVDAGTRASHVLSGEAGAYALTGLDASLVKAALLVLSAEPGAYALTGEPATLAHGFALFVEAGSYALSGSDAGLSQPERAIVGEPGAYLLTGPIARLRFSAEVPPFVVVQVLTRRMRRSAAIAQEDRWLFHRALQIDLETGIGLAHGQGAEPQVMLRWSDDGGETWSHEHWVSAGRMGQYQTRAVWERLGRSRDRVYETVVTDPVAWHLLSAILEIEPGTH